MNSGEKRGYEAEPEMDDGAQLEDFDSPEERARKALAAEKTEAVRPTPQQASGGGFWALTHTQILLWFLLGFSMYAVVMNSLLQDQRDVLALAVKDREMKLGLVLTAYQIAEKKSHCLYPELN